jgi:hypothetical protein
MTGLGIITIVGIAVLAVLVVIFLKVRQKDQIAALLEKRRADASVQSRADYVEGTDTIPVALSVVGGTLYYENVDLEASFDLDRIDEVEYGDELATGRNVSSDCRVLRLRSHGATFEFLLPKGDCEKWAAVLPQRTFGMPIAQAG